MYDQNKRLFIAHSGEKEICILPKMANRHGLITGATGTGKTVTLQSLAESFSAAGVPVFAADVKGDLSGLSAAGGKNPHVQARVDQFNLASQGFSYKAYPVCFWDVFGEQGHPIRATISDMGPLMLSRLMNLNDIQSSVLSVAFKIADDSQLLLLDLKDLKKMLEHLVENRADYTKTYGAISAASIGAIQRGLLQLEMEGGDKFFGEPSLNIQDLIQCEGDYGVINILAADKLMLSPRIYAYFLLWLMSELFENLPEVGDLDRPKMVFFFDEAHLLFRDTPKALTEKIEQTVRLIRSKGIGIYFITQTPSDIPESILGQLGNRIQHALRAFTPNDQKAVKAAAQTFRANPLLDVQKTISELGVGEALVSFLDEKGSPQIVERAYILPPQGQVGPIDVQLRQSLIRKSLVYGEYEKVIDRESAFEILTARLQQQLQDSPVANPPATRGRVPKEEPDLLTTIFSQATKSMGRQMGNQIGRSIVRGLLGSIFGKR